MDLREAVGEELFERRSTGTEDEKGGGAFLGIEGVTSVPDTREQKQTKTTAATRETERNELI